MKKNKKETYHLLTGWNALPSLPEGYNYYCKGNPFGNDYKRITYKSKEKIIEI